MEKPTAVLPPALQEQIMAEMEAKKGKKLRGNSSKNVIHPNGQAAHNNIEMAPQATGNGHVHEVPLNEADSESRPTSLR